MAVLSIVSAVACGQDDSPFPTSSSAPDAGGSDAPLSEQVADVCRRFCEAQFQLGCVRPELSSGGITQPSQCSGLCSFLELAPPACQEATREAYQCQLDNGACNMTTCNPLLRTAERVCPTI